MSAFLTAPILSAAYSAFGLVNSLFILYPTFLSLELPLPIGRDAAPSASSDENSLSFDHSLTRPPDFFIHIQMWKWTKEAPLWLSDKNTGFMQWKEGASENCFLKKAVSVIHLSLTMGFLILIPHAILPKVRILRERSLMKLSAPTSDSDYYSKSTEPRWVGFDVYQLHSPILSKLIRPESTLLSKFLSGADVFRSSKRQQYPCLMALKFFEPQLHL